ncbi:DUF5977 domain-containing protein [Pedobacter hiemivivus]|uniref:DUF5977 domain-containing protein n=1 Tax=Pedobacter hiemivivus TaxID=2530454 RepID=A0A4R0N695_9SPHI|nr:DUF5977 domain-containing protein [Pedobacter hiemivivus]TCC94957.1 hypothetical protein EZ444_15720 [Pedobacter hiemivivus]
MKKIFLFFSAILCFLSGYGQTLQTTATVTSGNEVILTASGESSSGYISSIQIMLPQSVITPVGTNVSTSSPNYAGDPYPVGSASKFKFTITGYFNSPATPITAKLTIKCTILNQNGNPSRNEDQIVTVTVNPVVQTSFPNQPRSRTFYKNDCGPGFESDPYTYSVPAGQYTASTQAAANALADAEITANGQNAANANRTCKQVYYNTITSASYTKNTCGSGYIASTEVYTVLANTYKAFSQAEADLKATNDLNANGQNFANTHGTCTEDRRRYRVNLRPTSPCTSSDEISGFVWIRRDLDLNNIYSQGAIIAYTSATGSTTAAEGSYKILYEITDNGEQGVRIFNVNSSGYINNYTLCSN